MQYGLSERKPILCPKCQTEMIFTKKITPPAIGDSLIGLRYRCPTRKGEKGCGEIKEEIIELTTGEALFR